MTILTQVLYPTSLASALVNCTGTVQDVQAIDSLWVEPLSHTSNTEIRVAFATPKGVLVGEQVLRVQVTKSQPSTGHPTATLNLYQNGVYIHGVVPVEVNVDTTVGTNLVFRFDASKFPDLSGANFVARITTTANAGSGKNQSAVRVGRFEWTVTADVPVVEKLGSVALSSTSAITLDPRIDPPMQPFFPSAVTNISGLADDPDVVSKLQDMWDAPDGLGAMNALSGPWQARIDFDIPSPMEQPVYLHWVFVLTSSKGPDDPLLVGAAKNFAGAHTLRIYYDGVLEGSFTSGSGSYYTALQENAFPVGTVYDPSLMYVTISANSAIKGTIPDTSTIGVKLDAINFLTELPEVTSVEELGQVALQASSLLAVTGEVTRIANPITAEVHLLGASTTETEATQQLIGTVYFIATGHTSVAGNLIHPEVASANLSSAGQVAINSQTIKLSSVTVSGSSNASVDSIVTKLTRAILVGVSSTAIDSIAVKHAKIALMGTSGINVTQSSGSSSKAAIESTSTLAVVGRSIKASGVTLEAGCTVAVSGTVSDILLTSVSLEASSGLSVTAHKVSTAKVSLITKAYSNATSSRSRSAESAVQVTSEVDSSGSRVLTTEAALYSRATVTIEGKRVLSSTVDTYANLTQNVSALKQPTAKVKAQAKTSIVVLGNAVNNFKVTMVAKASVNVSGGVSILGKSNVVSMSSFRARGIKQVVSGVSTTSQASLTIEGLKQPTASVSAIATTVASASFKRIRTNKSHIVAKSLVTVTGSKTSGFAVEIISTATISVTGARILRSNVSLISNSTLVASLTDEKQLVSDESFLVGHIRMIETLIGVIPPEALLDAYMLDTSEIFLQGDVNKYEVLKAIRDYNVPLEGVAQ